MAWEEYASGARDADQNGGLMRIVAGLYKGRRLTRPSDSRVRVTTERVREALFSIISPKLPGAKVLDLFAGSGVLGLEALSRGAATVDFVELSNVCIKTVRANIKAVGVKEQTRVYRGDAMRFVERLAEGVYDLALADPPFSTDHAQQLLQAFRKKAFANMLSIEHRSTLTCAGDETRKYGDVALTFCLLP